MGPVPSGTFIDEQNREVRVPFVRSYKHLGATLAESHEMKVEIGQRIGIAQGAFAQIARQLVCNKALPTNVRLNLFHGLIGAKLFFGLGAFHTPPLSQLKRLQTVYTNMLRKVLKCDKRKDCRLSQAEVLQLAKLGDIRARLAVDRLLYAAKLFQHGPPGLHHLLHQELAVRPDAWLAGLKEDLQWLHAVGSSVLPPAWEQDMTPLAVPETLVESSCEKSVEEAHPTRGHHC